MNPKIFNKIIAYLILQAFCLTQLVPAYAFQDKLRQANAGATGSRTAASIGRALGNTTKASLTGIPQQLRAVGPPSRLIPIKIAIFDWDGTISLLRQGWEGIMSPLMACMLSGVKLTDEDWKAIVDALIDINSERYNDYRRTPAVEKILEKLLIEAGIQTAEEMKIALEQAYDFIESTKGQPTPSQFRQIYKEAEQKFGEEKARLCSKWVVEYCRKKNKTEYKSQPEKQIDLNNIPSCFTEFYLDKLQIARDARLQAVESKKLGKEVFLVDGGVEFIRSLSERGVKCFIVTGSETATVMEEVETLGLSDIIPQENVVGFIREEQKEKVIKQKKDIINHIVNAEKEKSVFEGNPEVLIIGDGRKEIEVGVEEGYQTLALRSKDNENFFEAGIESLNPSYVIDDGSFRPAYELATFFGSKISDIIKRAKEGTAADRIKDINELETVFHGTKVKRTLIRGLNGHRKLPDLSPATSLAAMSIELSKLFGCGDAIKIDTTAAKYLRKAIYILMRIAKRNLHNIMGEGAHDKNMTKYGQIEAGASYIVDPDYPDVDTANDPADGTSRTARGENGGVSILTAAKKGGIGRHIPDELRIENWIYTGNEAEISLKKDSIKEIINKIAAANNLKPSNYEIWVIDKQYHNEIVKTAEELGIKVRKYQDGTVLPSLYSATFPEKHIIIAGRVGLTEGKMIAPALQNFNKNNNDNKKRVNVKARIVTENSAYELEKRTNERRKMDYYVPDKNKKVNNFRDNATKLGIRDIRALRKSGYTREEIAAIMNGYFEFDLDGLSSEAGDIWLSFFNEPMKGSDGELLCDWGLLPVPVSGLHEENGFIVSETLEFTSEGVFLVQHFYPKKDIEALSELLQNQYDALQALSSLLNDSDTDIQKEARNVLTAVAPNMLNLDLQNETVAALESVAARAQGEVRFTDLSSRAKIIFNYTAPDDKEYSIWFTNKDNRTHFTHLTFNDGEFAVYIKGADGLLKEIGEDDRPAECKNAIKIIGEIAKPYKSLKLAHINKEGKIERGGESEKRLGLFNGGDLIATITKESGKIIVESSESAANAAAQASAQGEKINHFLSTEGAMRTLYETVENAIEAIMITDKNGTITYANKAAEVITGYSKEELISSNPRILRSDRHGDSFYKDFWETINAGKTWNGVFINKRKNGEIYLERQVIAPVTDSEGNITSFIALKQDVTEAMEIEDALKAQQERNALLAERLSDSVHNIKNHLHRIGAEADEWLHRNWWQAPQEERQKWLEVKSVIDLITMMIESNLRSVRGEIVREPLSLNELINDALVSLKIEGIDIVKELEESLASVDGDYMQLAQVLTNLITNAKEAIIMRQDRQPGRQNGTIKISTKTRLLEESDFAGIKFVPTNINFTAGVRVVEMSISDNGTGIDEADILRIFEPRFTTKRGGTGIGLDWVRRVINEHGGMIGVRSKPGEGTTFVIWFSISTQPSLADREVAGRAARFRAREEEEIPISREEASRYNIVIADDEEKLLELLNEILKVRGFVNIYTAQNGDAALAVLNRLKEENSAVNVIITDYKMGDTGLNGTEMIKKALNEELLSPTAVKIVVSGSKMEDIADKVEPLGAAFVGKPYRTAKLMNTLIRSLRGEDLSVKAEEAAAGIEQRLRPAAIETDIANFRGFMHEFGNSISILAAIATLNRQVQDNARGKKLITLLGHLGTQAAEFHKEALEILPRNTDIEEDPVKNELLQYRMQEAFETLEKGVLPALEAIEDILHFLDNEKFASSIPLPALFDLYCEGTNRSLEELRAFLSSEENRKRYTPSTASANAAAQGIAENLQTAGLVYDGKPSFAVILDCTEPKETELLKRLAENLPENVPIGIVVNKKYDSGLLANKIVTTSLEEHGDFETAVKSLRAGISEVNHGKVFEFKLLTLRKNLPYFTIDDVSVISPAQTEVLMTLNGLITSLGLSAKKDQNALNEALVSIAARLEAV